MQYADIHYADIHGPLYIQQKYYDTEYPLIILLSQMCGYTLPQDWGTDVLQSLISTVETPIPP